MNFIIVVPVKNEEKNIEKTIQALLQQTLVPIKCVFVDDASTDRTPEIVQKYQKQSSLIDYIKIKGKDYYNLGGHVISVFNKGKEYIDKLGIDYDYIIKLDADISFKKEFLSEMAGILKINEYGIASGTPYYYEGTHKIYDKSPKFHSKGQFKFYNKKCLKDIGNIPLGLGWDTADNIKAIEKGWKTARLDELEYLMHRKIGGKYSLKKGRINHGIGAYSLRYSFLYLILRIGHDLLKPPIILGAVYFKYGYLYSLLSKKKSILTRSQGKILRKILWREFFKRLISGDFYLSQKLCKIFSKKTNDKY